MPCTNQVCIDARVEKTHAWKNCGRIGGPKHAEYIAKKTEEEKAKNEATKNELLNKLYHLLLTILISCDSEGGKTGADHYRTLYPFEGRDEHGIAQKVIGMLKDAYGLGELKKIAENQDMLFQEFIDCTTVLHRADEEKTEHE